VKVNNSTNINKTNNHFLMEIIGYKKGRQRHIDVGNPCPKSSLRKFYGRHHDLVDRYEISVSQITTDMFHFS